MWSWAYRHAACLMGEPMELIHWGVKDHRLFKKDEEITALDQNGENSSGQ
jgi:hypothetical protein